VEEIFSDESTVSFEGDFEDESTVTTVQSGGRVEEQGVPHSAPTIEAEGEEETPVRVEEVVQPRRSERVSRPPQRLTTDEYGELHNLHGFCNYAVQEERANINEAMRGDDRALWEKALESEHQSIIKSGTYELVQRHVGRKILRTKYVLKIKRKQDGSVARLKGGCRK